MPLVTHFKELKVHQMAFSGAMRIFHLTKKWPKEEQFALKRQILDSSRSVCGCMAEAWRKRRYVNHFISKLTDADGEAAETDDWLDFALACEYITAEEHRDLGQVYDQISKGLVGMMTHAESWCGPADLVREEPSEYLVD